MNDDFFRLAIGLRAAVVDFDYYRTRKLLEPNWDGYTMPEGHDFVHTDIDLVDANLLTSQHRDNPDMHRIVLDLDYGVVRQPAFSGGPRLALTRDPAQMPNKYLCAALCAALSSCPNIRALPGKGVINIEIGCDYALIPSSTPGHHHLILDVNLPWQKYNRLLQLSADTGIIEPGYAKASVRRKFSAIRPPWIRKPQEVKTQ